MNTLESVFMVVKATAGILLVAWAVEKIIKLVAAVEKVATAAKDLRDMYEADGKAEEREARLISFISGAEFKEDRPKVISMSPSDYLSISTLLEGKGDYFLCNGKGYYARCDIALPPNEFRVSLP